MPLKTAAECSRLQGDRTENYFERFLNHLFSVFCLVLLTFESEEILITLIEERPINTKMARECQVERVQQGRALSPSLFTVASSEQRRQRKSYEECKVQIKAGTSTISVRNLYYKI